VFIFATYHWWWLTAASGALAFATILIWLWTGTAGIPEKETKDVGLGTTLPIYVSGPMAVGWWAMFITMLADVTAFVSLVFGYFFYWTIHEDFPPEPYPGPDPFWQVVGAFFLLGAWGATIFSRRANRLDRPAVFYLAGVISALLALAGGIFLVWGPLAAGLEPTSHVYPAIVWTLTGWTALHVAIGIVMQLYCLARRAAGRMTARYNADITNATLYWHFLALTVAITVGVIAGFPFVS
jgi:cytochrome c oxidase subunit I+III